MVALHRWNPEVNHVVLLFSCPFHFLMTMRDSRLRCYHFGKNFDHLLIFTAIYFSYLYFFLYFRLIPIRIISQLLALMPAVLFTLFASLRSRGIRAFFGSFILINQVQLTVNHTNTFIFTCFQNYVCIC